ncbi:MAG TPA: 3-carboxy-cis,cis-muconate cycloisomerase, partial [Gammaproteobacteria bacterium]|nr:3-carboxy-cis,cis-muconate cycloisomerase [Gammaproteobacteria bacterium]
LVMAEAATFELSKVISKRQASQVVKQACKNAMKSGSNMIDELEKIADAEVDWQQLKQPENHLGVADQIIGEVLDSC